MFNVQWCCYQFVARRLAGKSALDSRKTAGRVSFSTSHCLSRAGPPLGKVAPVEVTGVDLAEAEFCCAPFPLLLPKRVLIEVKPEPPDHLER